MPLEHTCVDFCKNDVFVWDEDHVYPIVQNPLNCVVGCDACAQVCPVEAITFPNQAELRERVRRLRTEVAVGAPR
ncbi:MAG: ferredoxin family protein [candidate division NC10 bacterium]|nr:ferredoxin family protein [candidate division NC10 bacterium]